MKEKLIARLKARRYNSYILYIVAGGYLLYLAYKMLREMDAGGRPLFYIAAALFGVIGLLLVSVSLLAMYKGWFIERVEAEREKENGDGGDKA